MRVVYLSASGHLGGKQQRHQRGELPAAAARRVPRLQQPVQGLPALARREQFAGDRDLLLRDEPQRRVPVAARVA